LGKRQARDLQATETFDVVILGFDDREELPEARLQRAFGIEPAVARELLTRLPATVQRAVSRVRAEYFHRALTMIGAQAEVRDQHGARVEPEREREPAAASAPPGTTAFQGYAEPTHHDASIALDATGRAPSPWHGDAAPVDPMSQTMAMAAPRAHMPPPFPEPTVLDYDARSSHAAAAAIAARAPVYATVQEAPAPGAANARAGLSLAPATVFDARPPSRAPQAAQPPRAASERPTTQPAFAAVKVSAPFDPPARRAPSSAAAPASDALAAPRATPTVVAGWKWDASAKQAPAAQPRAALAAASVAPPPAAPAATPSAAAAPPAGWLANMPSGVFDPPGEHADARDDLPKIYAPRDPSSVFDPPPDASADGSRRQPAAAAAPGRPQSAPLADFGFVSIERSPSGPDGGLSLGAAIDRKSAPGPGAPALTLDADPQAAALRVLSPWEQPRTQSMAEPAARPIERAPDRSQRPPRARAAQAIDAPGAAPAPVRARAPRPAARPAAEDAATPARRAPPAGPQPIRRAAERGATGASLANADTRSFWETIGDALVLPFTGPGAYWIGAITAWSAAVAVLGFFANFVFLLGAFVMFFANTSVLAFAGDYYRACLWAPATGEDKLDRAPDFDPVRLLNSYMKSGMHLMLFLIVSQVPLIAWLITSVHEEGLAALPGLALHPLTWLLLLLPSFYWPMGIAMTALRNDFAAIWNVPAGLRAIARAPAEYTLIVGIGMVTFVAAGIALFVFGSLLGVTGVVISGTLGFPLAVTHGIQGALMGHLVRARGEIFEQE
jgi:hypothetical protein